jgi:hypothetical protein
MSSNKGLDKMIRMFFKGLVIIILFGLTVTAQAQSSQSIAAHMLITAQGVLIRRAGTQNWQDLPVDAELGLSAGDQISTDVRGRAMIDFGQAQRLLVLGQSTFQLSQFDQTADEHFIFKGQIDGRSIQTVPDATQFSSYGLQAGAMNVTSPAKGFALRVKDKTSHIIVVAGEADVDMAKQTYTVSAQQGLRVADTISPITDLPSPANFAVFDGVLADCDGIVATNLDGKNLNVRMRMYKGDYPIGSVVNGTHIRIIAKAHYGVDDWYRVQFLSDYGWLLAASADADCSGLPTIEDQLPDDPLGFSQVTVDEMVLLQPFFGTSEDNDWAYRSFRAETTP